MTLQPIAWPSDLIDRYNVSGPRYTSYPTALSFTDWSSAQGDEILTHADPEAPLSLYVHIPFCRHLCYYCACNKVVTRDTSRADTYLDALEKEIVHVARFVGRRPVRQLHFGGGTPTFLTDAQTRRLCKMLQDAFNLDGDHTRREFSVEVDPRVTSAGQLALLATWGFNRVSLGVQDFNEDTQKAVHREQTYEQVAELIEAARTLGYRGINVDLIYGLPLQSVETFHQTLEQVITLRPDRIACYSYAHLPTRFSPQRRIISSDLPAPEIKLSLLQDTVDTLQAAGYRYIGMDHFALAGDDLVKAHEDGTLQRNFQGYSTHGDTELLGLGVSAISQIGGAYLQNEKDLVDYQNRVQTGSAVAKGYRINRDDRIRRHIIMTLACLGRVSLTDLEQRYDIHARLYFAKEWPTLEALAADGLIEMDGHYIRVTSTGRLLLRPICMAFDSHLSSTPAQRYSRVV